MTIPSKTHTKIKADCNFILILEWFSKFCNYFLVSKLPGLSMVGVALALTTKGLADIDDYL